jgi:hypothetical protein
MKKVTKKSSHPGCFFLRTGQLPCKAGKTKVWSFCPLLSQKALASGKITNALAAAQATMFYRLSPRSRPFDGFS